MGQKLDFGGNFFFFHDFFASAFFLRKNHENFKSECDTFRANGPAHHREEGPEEQQREDRQRGEPEVPGEIPAFSYTLK